jgi:hypothetical protein
MKDTEIYLLIRRYKSRKGRQIIAWVSTTGGHTISGGQAKQTLMQTLVPTLERGEPDLEWGCLA